VTSRTSVRDRQGRILGYLDGPDSLGRTRLLDYNNRTLGWYYRDRDYTVDDRNRMIGRGNQLLLLLK
jgi:hypothetical protein